MRTMMGLFLKKMQSLKMLGYFHFCIDWGSYTASIAKTASKKIITLIHSVKFLFEKVALYLYRSTIQPYLEFCYVWAGAPL